MLTNPDSAKNNGTTDLLLTSIDPLKKLFHELILNNSVFLQYDNKTLSTVKQCYQPIS